MQTLETLSKRIRTTEDLQAVVRTMKSLSLLSIRQYERAAAAMAQYHRTIELGLQVVLKARPPIPDLRRGEHTIQPPAAVIVFGADYGLCGGFNEQVVDYAFHRLQHEGLDGQSCRWVAVGTRVATRLEARGVQLHRVYSLPGSMRGLPETVERIIIDIDTWRTEGACDQVLLFYNRREPLQRSGPRMAHLLPLDVRYLRALADHPWESRVLPTFTMDQDALFAALVRQHLFTTVYRAGADSLAAEHAARLAAMQSAERSIADRLEEMNADYRQARQNTITSEILDIVAGYEVLHARKRH